MNDQSKVGGPGTTLETAIIFTTDMEALATFYQEGLDLGVFERSPGHIGMNDVVLRPNSFHIVGSATTKIVCPQTPHRGQHKHHDIKPANNPMCHYRIL